MNKQVQILLFAIALIFLAGIAGSILILRVQHSQTVQVVQDGNVLYTFDPSSHGSAAPSSGGDFRLVPAALAYSAAGRKMRIETKRDLVRSLSLLVC